MNIPQVKLAFMDDRKTKMLRDEREKEQRLARIAAALEQEQQSEPATRPSDIPASSRSIDTDGPPPYEAEEEE